MKVSRNKDVADTGTRRRGDGERMPDKEEKSEKARKIEKLVRPDYQFGFHDDDIAYAFKSGKGLDEKLVRKISQLKSEPGWMTDIRVKAFHEFERQPMPGFFPREITDSIDFSQISYFMRATEKGERRWEDVPQNIKNTFEKLGVPEAERKYLAGVTAQYDSEAVYHSVKHELEKLGVLFMDMDSGLRQFPQIVRQYFGSVVGMADNKFAALNTAAWSGGSFVYIPKGVNVEIPLQAYFRINTENLGQFERTLIIADEGSKVHYIEGCTAPTYSTNSLHAAVVEIVAHKGSSIRYTTIQNWSKNVLNIVTKRAFAYEDSRVEWVDGNLGSRFTAKYPAVYLMGRGASAEIISVAVAGSGQILDAGARIIAKAPGTSATVTSKSISRQGGRSSYRGTVRVEAGAKDVKIQTVCDALLMDEDSRSDTYPMMNVAEKNVSVGHEATVAKIGAEQIFYLSSRGLSEEEARLMVVNGFIEPFTKELPLEYAVELNRLMKMEMEGSVG